MSPYLWKTRTRFTVVRSLHVSTRCAAVDKQILSKLRKSTGFPFVNCRKALEKFDNDLSQAEKWLKEQAQKEGWAKATKLQGRPMSQGLIGLIVKDNTAAMVEVNCETDFVARNAKFHSFVSLITDSLLRHGSRLGLPKVILDTASFSDVVLESEGQRSVADLTALEVGNIGENIAVRRGVFYKTTAPSHHLASYVHITGPALQHSTGSRSVHSLFQAGKYGSVMLYSAERMSADIDQLGRSVCQHIVGMNPVSIGEPERGENAGPVEEEARLLHQEYMLDTTQTVGQVLSAHQINVLDFVRFECGAEADAKQEKEQEKRTEQSVNTA